MAAQLAIAEYRAMYDLIIFRMTSLDRRVPVTVVAFTTILGSLAVLPTDLQSALFVGLPPAALWFLKTTTNHARSFEDALRRVEQLESQLNELCGQHILRFQLSHPSRPYTVGGRTGQITVRAVLIASLLLLFACGFLSTRLHAFPVSFMAAYDVYLLFISIGLIHEVQRLRDYVYDEATTETLVL